MSIWEEPACGLAEGICAIFAHLGRSEPGWAFGYWAGHITPELGVWGYHTQGSGPLPASIRATPLFLSRPRIATGTLSRGSQGEGGETRVQSMHPTGQVEPGVQASPKAGRARPQAWALPPGPRCPPCPPQPPQSSGSHPSGCRWGARAGLLGFLWPRWTPTIALFC